MDATAAYLVGSLEDDLISVVEAARATPGCGLLLTATRRDASRELGDALADAARASGAAAVIGTPPVRRRSRGRRSSRAVNFVLGTDVDYWWGAALYLGPDAVRQIAPSEAVARRHVLVDLAMQVAGAGLRIRSETLPTFDGAVHRPPAATLLRASVRQRLRSFGFTPSYAGAAPYRTKADARSSHGILRAWLSSRTPRHVLDVGSGDGDLARHAASLGARVTTLDLGPPSSATPGRHVEHDLETPLPTDLGSFDAVLCADVLEHLRAPDRTLLELSRHLAPDGVIAASIPNVGHWYVRARVLLGRFDYDARGILDQTHLRFFTRRSFVRLARSVGYDCTVHGVSGLPFEILYRGAPARRFAWSLVLGPLRAIDRAAVRAWPTLFGYQFVFELRRAAGRRGGDGPAAR